MLAIYICIYLFAPASSQARPSVGDSTEAVRGARREQPEEKKMTG